MTKTSLEPEECCTDYGQFRRKAVAFHEKTGELVNCRADIPDTFFSIPATTKTETGYLTLRDIDSELEFRPYTNQDQSPAEYRKQYKKDCR